MQSVYFKFKILCVDNIMSTEILKFTVVACRSASTNAQETSRSRRNPAMKSLAPSGMPHNGPV